MTDKINIVVRKLCEDCGNPTVMYWCDYCQENGETAMGDCGHACVVDEFYHVDCK